MSIDVFALYFSDVTNPRLSAKVTYPLYAVFFFSICGVIIGCEVSENIEDFGNARLSWLQGLGLFKEILPTHETIERIISGIKPEQLQRSFISWMQKVHTLTYDEVVAIDNKTLRSSYDRE